LGKKLVVAGTGSEEGHLKKICKDNIKFTGFVAEEEIAELYCGATAFINPQEEDFGIAAVEAQAAGVPVIAYDKGGAKDTVIGGRTGVFFANQTVGGLVGAINEFEKLQFDTKDLQKNADRFSEEVFKRKFNQLLKKL
jgi:glycosyltransferase involved in cell wall biosynthesis